MNNAGGSECTTANSMPVNRLEAGDVNQKPVALITVKWSLEVFRFVGQGSACIIGLHSQHLIVALLVIEHGRCKVFEHIFACEWSMSLRKPNEMNTPSFEQDTSPNQEPFVPDEETMRVVI